MKLKKLLLFITAFIGVLSVKANDSEYFAYGNQLVPMRQTNIEVTSETLSIRLDNDGYANVDVYYTFENHSVKEQTILMGFETPTPYFMEETDIFPQFNSYIQDFKISLNGRNIPFKVAVVDPENEVDNEGNIKPIDWSKWEPNQDSFGGDLKKKGLKMEDEWRDEDHIYCVYAYYFNATFRPGQNELHHSYRYKMAVGVDYEYKLDYLLTPATRWANGKIGIFTLEINCEGSLRDFVIVGDVFDKCSKWINGTGKSRKTEYFGLTAEEFVIRDGTLVFYAENFSPSGELCLVSRSSSFTTGLSLYEDDYEIHPEYLVYETGNNSYWALLEYDMPSVRKMPALTRKIIRNIPYAARGHKFQNKQLSDFFNSCFWYIPADGGPDYKAVPLTPKEEMVTKGYNF